MKKLFTQFCADKPKFDKGYYSYWIRDPIYLNPVDVIWNVNAETRNAYIRKNYKGIKEEDLQKTDCWEANVSIIYSHGAQLLAFRKFTNDNEGISSLAHECLHICHAILSRKGVRFSNNSFANNEAYTYLLQFYTRTIYAALTSVPIIKGASLAK